MSCARTPPAFEATRPVVLSVGIAQPPGSQAPDTGLHGVSSLLQNTPLITIGAGGRPQPAVAEAWERSADGLTWRFRVRSGLTFHDGTPLDAHALAQLLAPDESSQNPFGSPPGLRDIATVVAPSGDEVLVRLKQRSSLLLEALVMIPVRGGSDNHAGAGPFIVESQRPGVVVLRAFEGYYRGRPQIDRVELRSYATQRAAWGAMMRREVDVLYAVGPEAVEFVEAGGDARTFAFLRPYVHVLGFNLVHPVLRRPEVRRALNAAIDRPAIVARALGGRGVAASGHVWPRHWTYDPGAAPPVGDPGRAVAALDAAGLPFGGRSASGDGPPSRFRFTALVPAEYPILERVALVLQKQLSDVGVDLRLEPVPLREFAGRLSTGQFEAYVQEIAAGQGLNWPFWFWHSGPGSGTWVRSGYLAADGALDHVRLASNDEELKRAVREFERTIADDPPALFLCWGEVTRAVHRRYEVPREADRDIMGTLSQWRLAPPGAR